jgi:hypothetical protein
LNAQRGNQGCDSNVKEGVVPIAGMVQVRVVAGPMVAMSVVNLVIGPGIAQKGKIIGIKGKMGNLAVKNPALKWCHSSLYSGTWIILSTET